MKPIKSKEPKLLPLLLTAFSGITLGIIAGGYLLLVKPVVPVSGNPVQPAASRPGDYSAYFTKGRVDNSESTTLRSGTTRIQRRTIGPVSFSEGEINYFFGQYAQESQSGENPSSSLEQFNVKINGDQMVVSFKLIVDPKGEDRFEMLIKANVGFENSDAGPEMFMKNLRVNSLPIPGLGGLLSSVIKSKIEGLALPDDLLEMWSNIRRIELESDKLILDIGLRRA